MIISFNISVHIWILYVFLFNGFVLSLLFSVLSRNFLELLVNVEAWFLSSFFVSILINGLLLLMCSKIGCSFSNMVYVLPLLSVLLLFFLGRELSRKRGQVMLGFPEFSLGRFFLYSSIFIILFINGGLIERTADSWWHMSLSNKIVIFNSFDVDLIGNHLNGVTSRYYPALWHGNLAMLHKISGISLPVIWNEFTAWGSVLKVMGFYLFALTLTNSKKTAMLSIVLFFLLPGLADSYQRIAAWPSAVSYCVWFCMFYLVFILFDKWKMQISAVPQTNVTIVVKDCCLFVKQNQAIILSFVALSLIVFFTHPPELLWFACSMLFYAIVLLVSPLFLDIEIRVAEPVSRVLFLYLTCGIGSILYLACVTYGALPISFGDFTDKHLIFFLWLCLAGFLSYLLAEHCPLNFIYNKNFARLLFGIVVVLLLLSVDNRQLFSLFGFDQIYPRPSVAGRPVFSVGWLGDSLALPYWPLELQYGLLYSGIVAILLSVFLFIWQPKRCTAFLVANAVFPFLLLVSPYLYQGLMDFHYYLSYWRLALLIFHPIVLACCLNSLWNGITNRLYE